ncbi:MAG: HesB/IscA family protein [Myxococcota bacterium]
MITLTNPAAEKIRNMATQHEMQENGVRVMVVGGGCSGLTYDMDFETEPKDGDEVFESDGVKVYIDPMSLAYLDGTKIDYVETFSFSGFHFENPNAQKSCGCGSSFTV